MTRSVCHSDEHEHHLCHFNPSLVISRREAHHLCHSEERSD
jgi:hypothetical protein